MFLADIVGPYSLESGLAVPQHECALTMHDMAIFYVSTILHTDVIFSENQAFSKDNLVLVESDSCMGTI